MKWQGRRGSRNIIDKRGSKAAVGGGLSLGAVGIVLVGWLLGVDLSPMLGLTGGGAPATQTSGQLSEADQQMGEFVSVTLADTEEVWADIFRTQLGQSYTPAQLVLFSQQIGSACGMASAATGPFYCPADRRVYLDTDFFATLQRQMGARGDFAMAYVVAHEVAHHVQNELGILGQANKVRAQVGQAESNAISVRIELQADCYSGIWTREAQRKFGTLERGDIEEAMNAAARIGDDTLQRQAGRRVRPDSFTHGSSEQRQRWFATGLQAGNLQACDTFGTNRL